MRNLEIGSVVQDSRVKPSTQLVGGNTCPGLQWATKQEKPKAGVGFQGAMGNWPLFIDQLSLPELVVVVA